LEASDFGGYLKRLRKEKKLTIRQLELYSKVSNAYISQMERGERGVPSPDILKKLSKPLGVDYEELMNRAGYFDDPDKELERADERFLKEIDDLELTEQQIIEKYNIKVDGIPLSSEQVKIFVNFIRAGRML
jgi:transcriptional regulator with XRE-family HTH domain